MMMTEGQMYKYNAALVNKIWLDVIKKYNVKKKGAYIKTTPKMTYFTIDRYECFMRIYVSENIDVLIRMNTINCNDRVNYRFFDFSLNEDVDIKTYRRQVVKLLSYIISECFIFPFAMEWRKEMTPRNASKEEIERFQWYAVWEGRLLEEHSYNEQDALNEWFERCINPTSERDRRRC